MNFTDWSEFADEFSRTVIKARWTYQDSQELLYQIRHPEWDRVRADVLMVVFKQEDDYCDDLNKFQDAYGYKKLIRMMCEYYNEREMI